MATITVYPNLDPRIVEVDAPDTQVTVQELYNLIRDWEDSTEGDLYPFLVDAAGKEDLGGGVVVGITVTLQNTRVRFAARTTVHSTGTVTTGDTAGETLTDNIADFTADGVQIGDTAFNSTTGAMETILSVGTTTLTSFNLEGGSRQDWQIGDGYDIYHNELCDVTGGNLVAVDDLGAAINPMFFAPNVNYTKVSSSSATLATQNLENLQYLIEGLRPSHSAFRDIWYVSPYSGSATNTGRTDDSAFATFAQAQAVAGDGDAIYFVADDPSGTTTLVEHINVTKQVLLRGPGPEFEIAPTTDLDDGFRYATVYVGHNDVEVSGLKIKTGPGTTRAQRALKIDADRFLGENIVIEDAHDIAIYIQNADEMHLKNIRIRGADTYGVYTQTGDSPQELVFEEMHVDTCLTAGFRLYEGVDVLIIGRTTVRDCLQGFDVSSGVTNLYLDPGYISQNTNADVISAGTVSHYLDKFKDRIWDRTLNYELRKLLNKAR